MPPLEQAYPPTENYPGIGQQFLRQIGLIKPHHPDITGLIPNYGFSAPPPTQHGYLCLPHISYYRLLIPLPKLRDRLPLTVVKMTVRKEIEHVPNRLHP